MDLPLLMLLLLGVALRSLHAISRYGPAGIRQALCLPSNARTHHSWGGGWISSFSYELLIHLFLIVPNAHGSGSRNPVGWETKLIDTIGGMVGFGVEGIFYYRNSSVRRTVPAILAAAIE